jgi:hypothetical protein
LFLAWWYRARLQGYLEQSGLGQMLLVIRHGQQPLVQRPGRRELGDQVGLVAIKRLLIIYKKENFFKKPAHTSSLA